MPAAVAIPLALGAGTAAAGIGAAALQSSAAKDAASKQQASAADALAFQRQQAAQDFANAQVAQKGNYDQWAARQGRLSSLGQLVGMQPFNIPAYQPLQQVTSMAHATGWNPPGSSNAPVDNRRAITGAE